ncbi:hypothetical protein AJ79_06344 [Helicocarpus griseus UAMH5409]|uniref:RNase III domain-containing protein n=1 Tax=Helicocarpus griseus UAMH5409 TaxID=1447875 RepID=A0A2B7XEA4_9EURO|nr:hypothetical protein AJ79_06344 [Helicocarpus griseus UAMH5409]
MAGVLLPTDDSIQAVKDIIGFKFHDRALLREALQAAGFASTDGNKKLALLGDAVLKPVLVMEGFANSRGIKKSRTLLMHTSTMW